ncbi:YciI family protein [Hamadaea sp. NPDC051192]|uniref:YciI family protein n=1 Tax=Hamadaea sp. NPDC051192 TaxID=3154940 RepID=UPI00344408FE
MHVIELSFDGNPDRLAARPAHREYLAALHAEGVVVASGPFPDDSGALLIFDVDRARVDQIIAEDAYYRAPGVTVVSVREWSPIFGRALDK